MRMGLYGLPCAGKTYILEAVRNFGVLEGSKMLLELSQQFHSLHKDEKDILRKTLAANLKKKDNFIMDGHYSFGDDIVFTEEDGTLYDVIIYLYVRPDILMERMRKSAKNKKYLAYDIEKWQNFEMENLRHYCHTNDKDFYIIDHPLQGYFKDISIILDFIDNLLEGFSCRKFAEKCTKKIISYHSGDTIVLSDGDKTLSSEDSSALVGYRTHLFDGNFYTGFQSWIHNRKFYDFMNENHCQCDLGNLDIHLNEMILREVKASGAVLTSGYYEIWKQISHKLRIPFFYGEQMSAETKFFIVKYLQQAGKKVKAYGDGMNDYFMLRQADIGCLMLKKDGTISRSLIGRELEGIVFVHN
ncbi:MAG: AAA family ATPase [Lachnospiraceae bacterium]|nr:AAA family ATPase [Lachnospiraceae bacterium]